MPKNKNIPQPKAAGAFDSLRYEAAGDVGARLSVGDSSNIKSKAEQTGSSMVDKMMEDYEIKAENSGFATGNNKFNSSSL